MVCFIGSILWEMALSHPLVAKHVLSWPKHARARLGLVRVLRCTYVRVCVCVCVCLSVCNYACVRLRTYVQATPDPLGLDRTLRRFGGLIGPIFFFFLPPSPFLPLSFPYHTRSHTHTLTSFPHPRTSTQLYLCFSKSLCRTFKTSRVSRTLSTRLLSRSRIRSRTPSRMSRAPSTCSHQ